MSMKKDAYGLANEIKTDTEQYEAARLGSEEKKKYETSVLAQIHSGGGKTGSVGASRRREPAAEEGFHKKRRHGVSGRMAAACAAAVLLLAGTVFHEEVHAAIEHINWSIGSALGLEKDLVRYRDVLDTAVSDSGYVITLQEAVAADEKLLVNYTIQREDGGKLDSMPDPWESLYINGKLVMGGVSGSAEYLDDTHTAVGFARAFPLDGRDLAGENAFELRIRKLTDGEKEVKGRWEFAFSADGSELIADTYRLPIGKEYTLPNGITVTLEEFTSNDLEQRVNYHASGADAGRYDLKLVAVDEQGRQTQFYTRYFRGKEATGYMQNAEILDAGRIAEDAGRVTVTLYAAAMPEESGKMSDDYVQIGEAAEWGLNR